LDRPIAFTGTAAAGAVFFDANPIKRLAKLNDHLPMIGLPELGFLE
jgi:hypothetical protein